MARTLGLICQNPWPYLPKPLRVILTCFIDVVDSNGSPAPLKPYKPKVERRALHSPLPKINRPYRAYHHWSVFCANCYIIANDKKEACLWQTSKNSFL